MPGFIDPGIVAKNDREAETLRAVLKAGLRLERISHRTDAVRLTGPGVHVAVDCLRSLMPIDLRRPSPHELKARSYTRVNEARRARTDAPGAVPTVEAAAPPQHRRESVAAPAVRPEPLREPREGLAGRRPDADLDRLV